MVDFCLPREEGLHKRVIDFLGPFSLSNRAVPRFAEGHTICNINFFDVCIFSFS
jgi:hypothetical protein